MTTAESATVAGAGLEAPRGEPAMADPVDSHLAELHRLAEKDDREAFGRELSELHGRLDSADDPRWSQAVALAETIVPGHPLLGSWQGQGPSEADLERAAQANRELMDWLERDSESEPTELVEEGDPAEMRDEGDGTSEDRAGQEQEDSVDQDFEDELADLARLSNRLDAEDESETRFDEARLSEEDPEPADQELGQADLGRQALGDDEDQPLNLDFEFSATDDTSSDLKEKAAPESDLPQPRPVEDQQDFGFEIDPAEAEGDDLDHFDLGSAEDEGRPRSEPEDSEVFNLNEGLAGEPEEPEDSETASGMVEFDEVDERGITEGQDEFVDFDDLEEVEKPTSFLEDQQSEASESAEQDQKPEMTQEAEETQEIEEPAEAKKPLSDDDVELKLDLARAYISMSDEDSARALLEEIAVEGTETQKAQAARLLDDLK